MKPVFWIVTILGALCGSVLGHTTDPGPTAFESFAAKPERVISFKQIGSLLSSDAEVVVTVLVVEDVEDPPTQMRGARFDLKNNSTSDHVFLDRAQLVTAQRDIASIEMGIERLRNDYSAPYRVQGTESCWMPSPALRILCPEYYIGPDGSGLRLHPLGGRYYQLPDRRPSELADLIDRAITELDEHL